jgi:signal transduction histidine kinase
MTVSDNGRGLQPGGRQKPGSFGLVGIEERVKILGGTFAITSGSGSGTTISVSVPADYDSRVPQQHDRDSSSPTEPAFI